MSNLSFLNAQEGWSVGFDGISRYVIHHTSTSGLKWDVFSPAGLTQANADQVLLSLTFITNTTGWLIIQDGQGNDNLFQTTTSGHTWYALHPVIG
jgi:hypothetical protein